MNLENRKSGKGGCFLPLPAFQFQNFFWQLLSTKTKPNQIMKKSLLTLLITLGFAIRALAHGGGELGPNGGRLVEFGGHDPLQVEFAPAGDHFVVSLYDEAAKKVVPVTDQVLIITHKEANQKIAPALKDGKWTVAKPAGKEFWLIVQLKENATAKAKNGRLRYDESLCPKCKAQEWLCKCED